MKVEVNILIGIIIFILVFTSSIYFFNIDLQYNIDRCNKLNSNFNSYDFDYAIETNADYSKDCYRLKNHPFIVLERVLLPSMLTGLMGLMLLMVIMILVDVVGFSNEMERHI